MNRESVNMTIVTYSEISRDIAQIFFGTMVVGSYIEKGDLVIIGIGIFLSLVFWYISIHLINSSHGNTQY